MNRLIFALALTPALLSSAAMAQTAPEDASRAMWCGEALVVTFSNAPSDATSDQLAKAQEYIDAGNGLIDGASQKYLNAGFTEEQLNTTKANLVTEVTKAVTVDAANAKYSYGDCIALLPAPLGTGAASGAASSEAPAASSSAQ